MVLVWLHPPGRIAGTRKTFEIECAKPIVRAREKDAKKLPNFHFLKGFWSTKSVKAYLSICFIIMDLLVIKEIKISYIFFSPLFSHSSILPKSPWNKNPFSLHCFRVYPNGLLDGVGSLWLVCTVGTVCAITWSQISNFS